MDYLIQSEQMDWYSKNSFLEVDLTNDGMPELVVNDDDLRIYMCKNGKVYTAFELEYVFDVTLFLLSVQDMNLDGVPELFMAKDDWVPVDKPWLYQILEWDGDQFRYMITPPDVSTNCWHYNPYGDICSEGGWIITGGHSDFDKPRDFELRDIDLNGTRELVIYDGLDHLYHPEYSFPERSRTSIFMWNGSSFTLVDRYIEPPSYRFEALQDGEVATIEGRYDQALDFYQQVIFDDKLDWWSEKKSKNLYDRWESAFFGTPGTPTPTLLPPDPNEYNNLAAYARYRIMIIHVLRGDLQAAQVVYDALQEKFPSGSVGHEYEELASAFWMEYQNTRNISRACERAIAFTKKHTYILYYISHRLDLNSLPYYEPHDVCPF